MIVKFIVIGIYFAILLLLGALASRRIRDERDYIVGGKKLGFWLVSFSARATGESAWLILGLSGLAYKLGLVALWVVLGETLGVAICWLFMTKRFKRLTDRYDSSTVPDYLTDRVHSRSMAIRWVSAIALTVFVSIYVSAQLHATGQAFEGFLQVDYHIGVAVGFVVVLVYIVSGGFIAVVWSDLFQGALMLAALIGLPIFGLALLGGPSELFRVLAADDPGLLNAFGPAGFTTKSVVMIVGLVAVGVGYLGSPQVFVRFISIADTDEIDKGRWVAISYTIIAGLGAVFTAWVSAPISWSAESAPNKRAPAGFMNTMRRLSSWT